jgi:hypothetical protein|tara:strand:- start:1 stop:396 length:396 start_codon:yes stop_codon:yes gene_type:complete
MKKIMNFRVVNRQIFHYPFKLDLEKLKKCNPPYNGNTFEELKTYFNKYILDNTSENRKGVSFFDYDLDSFPYLNEDWFEDNKELMGEDLLNTLEDWKNNEGQLLRDYFDPSQEDMVDSDTIEIDVVEDENY